MLFNFSAGDSSGTSGVAPLSGSLWITNWVLERLIEYALNFITVHLYIILLLRFVISFRSLSIVQWTTSNEGENEKDSWQETNVCSGKKLRAHLYMLCLDYCIIDTNMLSGYAFSSLLKQDVYKLCSAWTWCWKATIMTFNHNHNNIILLLERNLVTSPTLKQLHLHDHNDTTVISYR